MINYFYNSFKPSEKSPYANPILNISKTLTSIIGLLDFRNTNLAWISNSKNIKAINAPTGSIKASTPLIIPRELPAKKPDKKIIANNEYLLQGFTAQFANLSTIFVDDLYKNVFCSLGAIREKIKNYLRIFSLVKSLT